MTTNNKKMTLDQMALREFLTTGRVDKTKAIAARINGTRCPECGSEHVESNEAERLSDRSYRCDSCGNGWDAV